MNQKELTKTFMMISNGVKLVHGPDSVTVQTPPPPLPGQYETELFCSLDLPQYQKSMPSKTSWDGPPVLGHIQKGRRRNLEITFCSIT